MQKKKILAWCDFVAPTGFANVAKNLLQNIHQDFDLSIVGINYFGERKYDTDKYFVYSVTQDDPIGVKRLMTIAKREQPDIIFLFQDIFHISDIIDKLKFSVPKAKIVIYFPIDGGPFSIGWKNALDKADVLITYSDWAISVIKDRFPDITKPIYKLYHGVDTSVFFPLTKEEIINYRKITKWENKFVVINLNRYQPRKAIPLTLRAYSMFSKGYKVCKCGNVMPIHSKVCDLNGCPPEDIIETNSNKKDDVYLYLHMMAEEFGMGPGRTNTLQSHVINAGFTDAEYNKIIGINGKNIFNHEVSESDLNQIYNASNVNISSTLGEGCGLSLLESAATGTPSIAPRNSAIPEQLRGTGKLVNNLSVYSHPNDNAHIRPVVDPFKLTLALEEYYQEWKQSQEEKIVYNECIANIESNFLWQDKRDFLLNIFKKLV